MKNRIPTKPNRYAVYDDAHNFLRHEYHERADEPTEVGTAINKATLLSDETAAKYPQGTDTVDKVLNKLGAGMLYKEVPTPISSAAVGTVFALEENGVETFFIKLLDNYNSSGRTLVRRLKSVPDRKIFTVGYFGSTVDTYCNSDYITLFSQEIQGAIRPITLPGGQSRKAFMLSEKELGGNNGDGIAIPYFNSNKMRITGRDGLNQPGAAYGTRTQVGSCLSVVANEGAFDTSDIYGLNLSTPPAFTLPPDFIIGFISSITDMLGSPVYIPAAQIVGGSKIETGSYVGTQTYGSGSPNSLTFSFAPKILFIYGYTLTTESSQNKQTIGMIISSGEYRDFSSYTKGVINTLGNTVQWYTTGTQPAGQLNLVGQTYYYVAIG